MRRIVGAMLVFVAAWSMSGSVAAQDRTVNIAQLGPQVGEQVPDFSLPDQNGTSWTLGSIMGPKGAMLVFVRSADW